MEERGVVVDCFVLEAINPIQKQCINNLVPDCS